MYHTKDILDGARTIRPYLADPLQLGNAAELEQQLDVLLQQTDDPDRVADAVLDVLAQDDATRGWMQRFLESHAVERSYQPPPGKSTSDPPPVYICPKGGCHWIVRFVGDPPRTCQLKGEPMGTPRQPWCPTEGVALQRCEQEM